ncbi:MAG TPA: hypothetical protein VFK36_07640 [Gemmatimonadales bacterium]|nr:hypothetical protein [Gemmatimonadales bacterium]
MPCHSHRIVGGLAVAAMLLPSALRAEGWVTLPNGEPGYVMNYTFTGHFSCGATSAVGSCIASDNFITITNGDESLTLTFLGLSGSLTATSVRTPMEIGALTTSFTGTGDFIFPAAMNPNVPLFTFYIDLTTTDPLNATRQFNISYRTETPTLIAPNCCSDHKADMTFPVSSPPDPFTYTDVIFDTFQPPVVTSAEGTTPIYASVGLVPEPTTVTLLASGLLGLLGIALVDRKRRTLTRS